MSNIVAARRTARRRTRRALSSVVLATVAALSVSACGFVGGSDDPEAAGGGTLTTFTNSEQARGLESLYEAYRQSTGAAVQPASAATDELNQQLRVQLTSGTAPDIIRVSPGFSSPVAAGILGGQGSLADLSGESWAAAIDEGSRQLATADGKLVAFPIGRNAILMAYNKQVFADLELSVPTTWTEMLEVSKALEDAGKTPIAVGLTGGVYLQFFIYALAGILVYADDPDIDARMQAGETSFVDDASWNEVFEKFVTLSEYFTPDSLGVPADQAQQALARGDAGMTILVAAGIGQLYEYAPEGQEAFGLFALPATDNPDETLLPTAPDYLAVNAASPRIEQAKALLNFLARPENLATYADTIGVIPGAGAPTDSGEQSPLRDVLPLISAGRTSPFANYLWPNGATQQTMLQAGQQLVAGEIDVPELLRLMDEQYAKGTP